MPALPPVVYVPPSAGAPPAAPAQVFAPAPAGKAALVISGVTTAGINGYLIYCGLIAGKPAWSTDGTQTAGDSNTIVEYISGTSWKVSRASSYSATKVSAAATPDGLTAWTIGIGSGQPTIAALAVRNPPGITTGPAPFPPPAPPPVITA
jgi:hypothetical protein